MPVRFQGSHFSGRTEKRLDRQTPFSAACSYGRNKKMAPAPYGTASATAIPAQRDLWNAASGSSDLAIRFASA